MSELSTPIQHPTASALQSPLGELLWPRIYLRVYAHNPRQADAIGGWIAEGRNCAFVAGRIAKAMRGSAVYFERARKLYEDRTALRLHALGRADWKLAVLRVALERGEPTRLDPLLWDEPDIWTLWVLRTAVLRTAVPPAAVPPTAIGQAGTTDGGDDLLLLRFHADGTAQVDVEIPADDAQTRPTLTRYGRALLRGEATEEEPPVPCATVTIGGFVVPRPELWQALLTTVATVESVG